MKRLFAVAALLAVFESFGQLMTLSGSTNVTYSSASTNILGWTRQVVMGDQHGNLIDKSGTIVSYADTVAVDAAAEEVKSLTIAAQTALTNSLDYLYSATQGMATASFAMRMVVVPETSRENLTAFVVDVSTDGSTDTLWVWYNRSLSSAPNRSQTYSYYGGVETQKCQWRDTALTNWVAEGTVRTVNGRTWNGVHKCIVERPTWAKGLQCQFKRNDGFGLNEGFDFGNYIVRVGGAEAYTGYVENRVTGEKWYFENGFRKEDPNRESEE